MQEQTQETVEPETLIDVEVEEELDEDVSGELAQISGAEALRDTAGNVAQAMDVEDYKGVGTNLGHGHDRKKHDVRSSFNVNDDFVKKFFHFDPADHAAPHELLARKDEFVRSEIPLFEDTNSDDPSRWSRIRNVASNAPIPDEAHRELERISNQEL